MNNQSLFPNTQQDLDHKKKTDQAVEHVIQQKKLPKDWSNGHTNNMFNPNGQGGQQDWNPIGQQQNQFVPQAAPKEIPKKKDTFQLFDQKEDFGNEF